MIEIQCVDKFYGEGKNRHQALRNINLSFRNTEFVAILGPSGSGKTTLLNVIGGLDHYDSGDLIIDDISTRNYSSRDWDSYRNHSIGFIFQSYHLIQHQSVLSNVEMALTIAGISGAEKRRRAEEALHAVGLGEHLNKRPNQLSGGQMQRVAIARALVNRPSVILADEPTGALDSRTSVQVMEILRETARDHLVIMVTHNPELAKQYASRIITLKDGEIQEDTNPYTPPELPQNIRSENMGYSSMGLLTAMSLSFHNLWTKRRRTCLTAFAGSIGIIGIALIAALSTGVNGYIARQEANMAYSYPLLVETLNMDLSSVLTELGGELSSKESDHVEVIGYLEKLFAVLDTNDVGAVKEYIEQSQHDITRFGAIEYVYNVQPQIYVEYGDRVKRVCPDFTLDALGLPISSLDTSLISSAVSTNMFYCMPRDASLYEDRYDVKAGRWPVDADECILVLSSEGKISDYLLYVLGLRDPGKVDQFIRDFVHGEDVETEKLTDLRFRYEDFLGIGFKVIDSSACYCYDGEYGGWRERTGDAAFMRELVEAGRDLKIVGVVQPKPEYGTGVLWSGVNYPFALVEDTVARARESEIVQAQLAAPDVDVFTDTPFEEMDSHKSLDPTSLISVDIDTLWNAVAVDRTAMQQHFMEGADFDSVRPAIPQIDAEAYLDIDEILTMIRTRIGQDLPGLLGELQLPPEVLQETVRTILTDYLSYMDENGYLNLENLSEQLAAYFASDGFRELVRQWAEGLDAEHMTEEAWKEAIGELSGRMKDSLNAWLERQGIPSVPYFYGLFQEYLGTERWKPIVGKMLERQMEASGIPGKISEYLDRTLQPMVSREISGAVQQLQRHAASEGQLIVEQTKRELKECMARGFEASLRHIPDCISADMDVLADAFSMRLDTQELSDLLLSFTNLSKASLSKNLNRLGYVEMSHPKSIRIYPDSFESKDAIISVLNRYNESKEIMNDRNHTVSYTDTLGAVMSTLTRIISIITGALMATVAVSLVVSSIMIGVITYISVLERRKEIGILRAMGASRHNISQIFNAETFITGLLSGVMGVGFGYLLLLPLNWILHRTTGIQDIRAFLPAAYAAGLILTSVVLTTLGGMIPSHNASKSDPVESLRTE